MNKTTIGVGLLLLGAGGIWAVAACSSTTKPGNDGGSSSGVACDTTSAAYPDPKCDPQLCDPTDPTKCSAQTCKAGAGACMIDTAKCGSTDTCMPLADNAGKTKQDFRMRRLNIVSPSSLGGAIQGIVIDPGINLKAAACGESGKGTFSWLLRVDRAASTLTTGGAPITGTFDSYCFLKGKVGAIDVQPVTVKLSFNGDTFTSDKLPTLNVPIFIDESNPVPIILPLHETIIKGATISDNGNCIGHFQKDSIAGNPCLEIDKSSCSRWVTGGSLGGYITLEEADGVDIADTQRSLCVQLTGDGGGPMTNGIKHCTRTNGKLNVIGTGNYCSTSKKADDCKDSYWLSGTFAASAVKIDDAPTRPECLGTAPQDGGVDSGPADSGTD